MSQTATVYAQALYGLAKEEQKEQAILQQLDVICQAAEAEPEYLRLLQSPALSKAERCHLLDAAFRGSVEGYLLNFLKILAEKGTIRHLPAFFQAYRAAYYADYGILPVEAVTAVPMTPAQLERLTDKLQSMTGKTVLLQNTTDPAVLGGVRLRYDGLQVDGTVQNRLETMAKLLKNTVL